jgi:hypothetical protein
MWFAADVSCYGIMRHQKPSSFTRAQASVFRYAVP